MKFNELGRSMVEMLGVLAIIGVLSVGAISGYSKAMTKYKLNKSIENIDWLINVTYEYMFNIKPSGGSIADDSLVPYFIKMNLVPEEMIKKNDTTYLYDKFNNRIEIYNGDPFNQTIFRVRTQNDMDKDTSQELCMHLLSVAQSYYDDINYVTLTVYSGEKAFQYGGGKQSSLPQDLRSINILNECKEGSMATTIIFNNK